VQRDEDDNEQRQVAVDRDDRKARPALAPPAYGAEDSEHESGGQEE
jgi:hypothetical protein